MQKDKAADFANNIFLKVSIYSNININLSACNIKLKLSLNRISVVLFIDILLKKLVQYIKTNTEKRVALFYYIYTFINVRIVIYSTKPR